MNISKVNLAAPLAFGAKTTIVAPENMLSKDSKSYLESLGNKIGKPTDTIKFTIGDLQENKISPNSKAYMLTNFYKLSNLVEQHSRPVPYIKNGEIIEKNSPKNYIEKLLKNLMKLK